MESGDADVRLEHSATGHGSNDRANRPVAEVGSAMLLSRGGDTQSRRSVSKQQAGPDTDPASCRRRSPASRSYGRHARSGNVVSNCCFLAVALRGQAVRNISTPMPAGAARRNTATCRRKSKTDHYRQSARLPRARHERPVAWGTASRPCVRARRRTHDACRSEPCGVIPQLFSPAVRSTVFAAHFCCFRLRKPFVMPSLP